MKIRKERKKNCTVYKYKKTTRTWNKKIDKKKKWLQKTKQKYTTEDCTVQKGIGCWGVKSLQMKLYDYRKIYVNFMENSKKIVTNIYLCVYVNYICNMWLKMEMMLLYIDFFFSLLRFEFLFYTQVNSFVIRIVIWLFFLIFEMDVG